jgi:DNA-binding winged helix-turn-helix (wHTH) protein
MPRNEQQMGSPVSACVRQARDKVTPCNHLSALGARYIRFGPFLVDRRREALTRDGSRIKLSGKKYTILLVLLENPGEVVSRDAICRNLWPSETDIDQNSSLTTMINTLRRILGDCSFSPVYIQTIPGKGYMFIAHREVSDHPNQWSASNGNQTGSFNLNQLADQTSPRGGKSRLFSVRGIIRLVLIGIVLGAAMMAVWMSYHVRARPDTERQDQSSWSEDL